MRGFAKIGATALALAVGGVVVVKSQQAIAQIQRFEQFENDDVHVWKTVIPAGAPAPMHRHDHPRIAIALSSGTLKLVEPDGKSETHVWEAGKAYWMPAMAPGLMHADVNAGSKPIEVVMVELKKER